MPDPTAAVSNNATGLPANATASPSITPSSRAVPFSTADRVPSYTFFTNSYPLTLTALAVIEALALTPLSRYRSACSPPRLYPLIVTTFPTPTILSEKLPTPLPTRLTASPLTTPTSTGVPLTTAVVVPSYSFDAAPNPLTLNSFFANCTVNVPVPVPAALRALTTTENVPT